MSSNLPSPEQLPDADVLIYDGNCRICVVNVSRLPWWDCQQKLAYLSLHDPAVASRWPDLSHSRLLDEMCVIDSQGRRHWGPEVFRYLSLRLRRLWWAMPILYFPGSMFLWRPLYRWLAKNRYRFNGTDSCDSDACDVHR